jgi:glycosyltransferase involved in cell wall biosynthesis
VEYENFDLPGHRQTPPPRPPRILFVGSDTIANLDGLRWFRRQVFPQILQSVPTCRLRVVGEAARHIEPGPAIDQVGPVDHVEKEYDAAAVVILPLRMGSGVRRRAVEAIAARKALVTTSIGAYGLSLRPMQDAVVSDDPGELASETIRILSTDQLRIDYEENAVALARRDLNPRQAMASLCRALGLPLEPERTPGPEPTTV